MEIGWVFHHQEILGRAIREGCRVGAVTPSSQDPSVLASLAILDLMDQYGYACPVSGDCQPSVSTVAFGSERILDCSIQAPVTSITHYIPLLDGLRLSAATRTRVEWR